MFNQLDIFTPTRNTFVQCFQGFFIWILSYLVEKKNSTFAIRFKIYFIRYVLVTITAAYEFFWIQSRNAWRTIERRRSNAVKCGCHNIGASGSCDIDLFVSIDNVSSLLWTLEIDQNVQGSSLLHFYHLFYRKSVCNVVSFIKQHCRSGARIFNSSWNGLLNDLPWSYLTVNESYPKFLAKCI